MKSISAFAIVSIIAILLAIGLIYFVAKPPKMITTTSYIPITSYIPTTYTETTYIPTTYYFTTTYTLTTTYQTPPTTITKTITEIITYTYVPEEKIEITFANFLCYTEQEKPVKDIYFVFNVVNKEYSSLYLDSKRHLTIEGKGILKNIATARHWYIGNVLQIEPFILSGSPYNPPEAECWSPLLTYPEYFNPKEIKKGQQYKITFEYKVIYLNGTMSDWKKFSFNITYNDIEQDP